MSEQLSQDANISNHDDDDDAAKLISFFGATSHDYPSPLFNKYKLLNEKLDIINELKDNPEFANNTNSHDTNDKVEQTIDSSTNLVTQLLNQNESTLNNQLIPNQIQEVIDLSQASSSSSSYTQILQINQSLLSKTHGNVMRQPPLFLPPMVFHKKRRQNLSTQLNRNVGIKEMNYLLMAQLKKWN